MNESRQPRPDESSADDVYDLAEPTQTTVPSTPTSPVEQSPHQSARPGASMERRTTTTSEKKSSVNRAGLWSLVIAGASLIVIAMVPAALEGSDPRSPDAMDGMAATVGLAALAIPVIGFLFALFGFLKGDGPVTSRILVILGLVANGGLLFVFWVLPRIM